MPKTVVRRRPLWTVPLLILLTGCSPPDDRLVELGQQSCERQAEQNQTIAEQSQQVTQTTQQFVEATGDARKETIELQRELVQSEADARQELIAIQQDLVDRDTQCRQELNSLQRDTQAAAAKERTLLDRQREDLEAERQRIASERQRAPIVAAAITQVGLLLACLLPLVLCGYLLYILRHSSNDDAAVTELLIEELVAERPCFLPQPGSPQLLPGSPSPDDGGMAVSSEVSDTPTDSEADSSLSGPR